MPAIKILPKPGHPVNGIRTEHDPSEAFVRVPPDHLFRVVVCEGVIRQGVYGGMLIDQSFHSPIDVRCRNVDEFSDAAGLCFSDQVLHPKDASSKSALAFASEVFIHDACAMHESLKSLQVQMVNPAGISQIKEYGRMVLTAYRRYVAVLRQTGINASAD